MPEWSEEEWELLLRRIEDEKVGVVPVLGPDLVRVTVDGTTVSLSVHLARTLAKRLRVPADDMDGETPFDSVAERYLSAHGTRLRLTEELCSLVTHLTLVVPEPLRQLAEIEHFTLYVTTAFDPLLAQALKAARGKDAHLIPYCGRPEPDLPRDEFCGEMTCARTARRPVVCQLLGEPSNRVGQWAITEEDRLEFHYALQAPTRQPELLFSELKTKHLLLLDGGYPDWLARFFLRNIRGDRLSVERPVEEFVVDPKVLADKPLRQFLSRYSRQTHLHPTGDAIAFIAELHRRYVARHAPRTGRASVVPAGYKPPTSTPPKCAVFLSYARDDLASVQRIYTALDQAGIAVWFDLERLEGGDSYQRKIFGAIDEAQLFIPIISRSTLDRKPRFFRLEWNYAATRMPLYPKDQCFVMPVFVDDLSMEEAPVPDPFLALHYSRLTDGEVTPRFIEEVARALSGMR